MTPGSPTSHGNSLSVALHEPVAFGENASGELFILDHRPNPNKGRLFRIIPSP